MFQMLGHTRGYNQAGAQPLRISELGAYLTEMGSTGPEREKTLGILLELDHGYMSDYYEKAAQKTA